MALETLSLRARRHPLQCAASLEQLALETADRGH